MSSHPGLKLIDVHHHVVLPQYEAALVRSGAVDPSRPLRKNSTPQAALDSMQGLGIETAIVNPLSVAGVHHGDDANARHLCETTNDALAAFAQAFPDRFGFFATLPLPDVDGALRQLEFATDTLKADGVVILSNQNGYYLGDPLFEPLYEEMNRRETIAFVHPASPSYVPTLRLDLWAAYIEYPFETTRVAANLIYNGVMSRFPNIRWILGHAGGTLPYLSTRLRLMEESDKRSPKFIERVPEGVAPFLDRFYFDVAIAGGAAAMAALTAIAKPSHILYGSDWPYLEQDFVTDQQEALFRLPEFSDGKREGMERVNAAKLFPRFRGLLTS